MPGLYDEVLAAGGWVPAGYGQINNPDSLQYWNGQPGQFQQSDPDGPNYHPNADLINAMQSGQSPSGWMERPLGGGSSQQIFQRPDGSFDWSTFATHENDDSEFWSGALAAGALGGAAIYGAAGAGAAAGTGGGAGAAGGTTAATSLGGFEGGLGGSGLGSSVFGGGSAGAFLPEAGGLTGAGSLTGGVSGGSFAGFSTPTLGASGGSGLFAGLENLGLRDYVNIGSGLYGMSRANGIASASDPFAQYRGYYGQRMMELEQNPSLITKQPGWEAGLEAIQRQLGAQGYLGSGNHSAALSRYAGEFTNNTLARYAQLAGAGQTPGAGQVQSADLMGRSLASIGYGLAPAFGRPGG